MNSCSLIDMDTSTTSSSKISRFKSFLRRSFSLLSESFEVKNSPKRNPVRRVPSLKTPQYSKQVNLAVRSPDTPTRGTTFSDILYSIELHMSIARFRILTKMKSEGLSVPDDKFYFLLDELRKQVFDLARDAYRKFGEKVFVHDFLYIEKGHDLRIILPHNQDLSEALYRRWCQIISEFRERAFAMSVRNLG
ncbi:uncharacterized protein LOC100905432 [Galendromus occidentalis]|uniref:Uncharacterized protein LOC100905432 n=1 Tax=Galendromus occidentalis TaxID=34638 RepID=A0AAJ6QTH2_9ACAR|nr:uncharacterized protein LOC100905432 [Galendromus occidentalis]